MKIIFKQDLGKGSRPVKILIDYAVKIVGWTNGKRSKACGNFTQHHPDRFYLSRSSLGFIPETRLLVSLSAVFTSHPGVYQGNKIYSE
jgi:hypothetical protein